MDFISIQDILKGKLNDQEVNIRGWVWRARGSGKIRFIILRDSTGRVQVTFEKENNPEIFELAKKVTIESAIEIKGVVKEDKRSPGGYEIHGNNLKVLSLAQVFPITKDQSVTFLMDKRHLWVRSRNISAILKIRAEVYKAFRDWFDNNGYIEVHGPMFTGSAVEGGSTLFDLKYFDKKAYLTQSSQFYLEAMIFSFEKVWTVAPSFRAEKSRTARHLTEFWMLEAEKAYSDLEDIMKVEEELVSYVCKRVAERKAELKTLNVKPDKISKIVPPFERISYDKAIEILQGDGVKAEWGEDLGTEEERILTLKYDKPIFVYDYPKKAKAFYHYPDPRNPEKVKCADLLAPGGYGEIIGGCQRIDDEEILLQRIEDEKLDVSDYEWYVDLRRYGSVPHSGFGLGVERVIRWLLKLDNIRDTIPFPRTINRIYP
ncbi:MAG: asparagine--tRNA ligase [Candidatus Helarchaeota archaeon]|nr:asparagine--tRNA ligase [Candidatus Helarchaeota archaeon]